MTQIKDVKHHHVTCCKRSCSSSLSDPQMGKDIGQHNTTSKFTRYSPTSTVSCHISAHSFENIRRTRANWTWQQLCRGGGVTGPGCVGCAANTSAHINPTSPSKTYWSCWVDTITWLISIVSSSRTQTDLCLLRYRNLSFICLSIYSRGFASSGPTEMKSWLMTFSVRNEGGGLRFWNLYRSHRSLIFFFTVKWWVRSKLLQAKIHKPKLLRVSPAAGISGEKVSGACARTACSHCGWKAHGGGSLADDAHGPEWVRCTAAIMACNDGRFHSLHISSGRDDIVKFFGCVSLHAVQS